MALILLVGPAFALNDMKTSTKKKPKTNHSKLFKRNFQKLDSDNGCIYNDSDCSTESETNNHQTKRKQLKKPRKQESLPTAGQDKQDGFYDNTETQDTPMNMNDHPLGPRSDENDSTENTKNENNGE